MKEAHKKIKMQESDFSRFMEILDTTMNENLKYDKQLSHDILEICESYRDDVLNRIK